MGNLPPERGKGHQGARPGPRILATHILRKANTEGGMVGEELGSWNASEASERSVPTVGTALWDATRARQRLLSPPLPPTLCPVPRFSPRPAGALLSCRARQGWRGVPRGLRPLRAQGGGPQSWELGLPLALGLDLKEKRLIRRREKLPAFLRTLGEAMVSERSSCDWLRPASFWRGLRRKMSFVPLRRKLTAGERVLSRGRRGGDWRGQREAKHAWLAWSRFHSPSLAQVVGML